MVGYPSFELFQSPWYVPLLLRWISIVFKSALTDYRAIAKKIVKLYTKYTMVTAN